MPEKKKRESREYLNNFNKKYYLFMCVGKKAIPIYTGTLKSILKFTTYTDYGYVNVHDEDSFKKYLLWNLNTGFKLALRDDIFKDCTFKIGPNKNGNNSVDLIYSDKADILFTVPSDIRRYLYDFQIKLDEFDNPSEEKLKLAKLICELIDKDYLVKLNEKRDSHKATTPLDVLRVEVAKSPDYYNVKKGKDFFEKFVLFDSDVMLYALEYICKDYNKKKILIEEINRIKPGYILANKDPFKWNKVYKERSWQMHRRLDSENETYKDIRQSIYDVLVSKGIIDLERDKYVPTEDETNKEIKEEKYFNNKEINDMFVRYLKMREEMQEQAGDISIRKLINTLNKYGDDAKRKIINEFLEELIKIKEETNEEEFTYEAYLLQEGITTNDAGEPLYDQDYDIDDMPRKR